MFILLLWWMNLKIDVINVLIWIFAAVIFLVEYYLLCQSVNINEMWRQNDVNIVLASFLVYIYTLTVISKRQNDFQVIKYKWHWNTDWLVHRKMCRTLHTITFYPVRHSSVCWQIKAVKPCKNPRFSMVRKIGVPVII